MVHYPYAMRICNKTLQELREKGLRVPGYDRNGLRTRIAHIGLGHFHRAHFLSYLERLLNSNLTDSGVFEINIVPADPSFIENLRKQDYMYSLLTLAPDGTEELSVNGGITGYANEKNEPEKVLEVLSSPDISLITLTITEKGYTYRDDIGSLDWGDKNLTHDLESEGSPVTAIGTLSRALHRRYLMNEPVTIMSCDNVPENGRRLRDSIMQFCSRKYPDMLSWLEENVAFPCTMVDRITPGTTEYDIQSLKAKYGLDDPCAVHSESFSQWVIEDSHTTAIPDFSQSGALITGDVRQYELMKIRLLNGSHSALSYPSYMMGYTMVDKAVSDPLIKEMIRCHYMEDIAKTLSDVPGIDINGYKDSLIERFSNPYIADTVLRLASDGSKKISNAILRPLEEGRREGKDMSSLLFALALWQYYYLFRDSSGNPMPLDDPKKDELLSAAEDSEAFLRIAGLGEESIGEAGEKIHGYLSMIKKNGVADAIRNFISG